MEKAMSCSISISYVLSEAYINFLVVALCGKYPLSSLAGRKCPDFLELGKCIFTFPPD